MDVPVQRVNVYFKCAVTRHKNFEEANTLSAADRVLFIGTDAKEDGCAHFLGINNSKICRIIKII